MLIYSRSPRVSKFWTTVLMLLTASLTVHAENLAPKGMILHDFAFVNEGKPFDVLLPVPARSWQDNTPFAEPDAVEIWFPYTQPVTVNAISFTNQFDVLQAGDVQAWDGKAWNTVGKLPTMSGRATGGREVKFAQPVTASAFRLYITKIGNTDHDSMTLTGFNIDGTVPKAERLYDPKDLTLSCNAQWNVFDLPAPATVQVSMGNSLGSTDRFRVVTSWQDTYGDPAGQADTVEHIVLGKGEHHTFTASLQTSVQGLYCATVSIFDEQRNILLASQRILVGIRDPKIFERGEVTPYEPLTKPIVPYAQHLKECGCIWTTELSQATSGLSRIPGEDAFRLLHKSGADAIDLFLGYNDFEPLPGVYNFAYFDKMVQYASKHDLGLMFGFWRWEFGALDQYWLKDEIIRQRDGKVGSGWTGLYSFWGPQYTRHAFRAVEVLVKRYQNSSNVWLWHPHPYGKVDHDYSGIDDCSAYAKTAFAQFLANRYGDITKLNAAYGTNYTKWDEVPMPDPLWRDYQAKNDLVNMTRVLDTRPQWDDYLTFFHEDGVLRWRAELMKLVRSLDPKRGFDGTNASGGVGAADKMFQTLVQYQGSYGDQDLDAQHYTRRFIAKLQYGLPSRYEDHFAVTPGRINVDFTERSNWDTYQACFVGANQFNYVFPTWDSSPFFAQMFANPRAQKIVKEAAAATIAARPMAHLHSFTTDTHEGNYVFNGISVYRWWVMNAFSHTMLEAGCFFAPFSEGGDLSKLDQMKLIVDDGSSIMAQSTIDRLVRFVQNGGKLVLFANSGERLMGDVTSSFPLLRALGYTDVDGMKSTHPEVAQLVMHQGTGIFHDLASLPVHEYCVLTPPKGGSVLGVIQGLPGAVQWPVGNGTVVLLGGRPGSITAATQQEWSNSSNPAVKANAGSIFGDAENELRQSFRLLMRDLSRWADVPQLFTVSGDFAGCLRQQGTTNLIYLFNRGNDCAPTLRVPLTAGKPYRVELETLTSSRKLVKVSGGTLLSSGITLPTIKHGELMLIRIMP